MSENQQSPAGDRQDPAEQYQTDTEVETSEQPDPEPTTFQSERYTVSEGGKLSTQPKEEYVGPSQPVTVAPGAAPTAQDSEPVEEPVQTPVTPEQPSDTSDDSSDDSSESDSSSS